MEAETPRLFLLIAEELLATRHAVFGGETSLQAADERLLREADQALYVGPFSVVDKEAVPPSGDQRDYMSQAPYWWPDPEREEGLPYVRRDGEVNPDSAAFDRGLLGALCSALSTLAPAYFFSDLERFAEHAGLSARLRIAECDDAALEVDVGPPQPLTLFATVLRHVAQHLATA